MHLYLCKRTHSLWIQCYKNRWNFLQCCYKLPEDGSHECLRYIHLYLQSHREKTQNVLMLRLVTINAISSQLHQWGSYISFLKYTEELLLQLNQSILSENLFDCVFGISTITNSPPAPDKYDESNIQPLPELWFTEKKQQLKDKLLWTWWCVTHSMQLRWIKFIWRNPQCFIVHS